jgi:hypothetical protein
MLASPGSFWRDETSEGLHLAANPIPAPSKDTKELPPEKPKPVSHRYTVVVPFARGFRLCEFAERACHPPSVIVSDVDDFEGYIA